MLWRQWCACCRVTEGSSRPDSSEGDHDTTARAPPLSVPFVSRGSCTGWKEGAPPPIFIMADRFFIWARMLVNAVSSPLTSTSVRPAPRAMRRRRAGTFARSSGSSRSWQQHGKHTFKNPTEAAAPATAPAPLAAPATGSRMEAARIFAHPNRKQPHVVRLCRPLHSQVHCDAFPVRRPVFSGLRRGLKSAAAAHGRPALAGILVPGRHMAWCSFLSREPQGGRPLLLGRVLWIMVWQTLVRFSGQAASRLKAWGFQ